MIDPEAGAEQWATLRVAGQVSPGVASVSGDGIKAKWDVKDGDGQDGATSDLKGKPIRRFKATILLANEEDGFGFTDFDRWDAFQDLLESSIADKAIALDMFHPALARAHITAASVENIGLVVPDGKGGASVTVDFIEFKPPKPKKVGSAKQVKTEGDKKIDAAKAEFEAELAAMHKPPAVIGDAL